MRTAVPICTVSCSATVPVRFTVHWFILPWCQHRCAQCAGRLLFYGAEVYGAKVALREHAHFFTKVPRFVFTPGYYG